MPEVQSNATGSRVALAKPSAMKPAERSSSATVVPISMFSAKAKASGVEREPGEMTTWRRPRLANVRTPTADQSAFVLANFGERAMRPSKRTARPPQEGRADWSHQFHAEALLLGPIMG